MKAGRKYYRWLSVRLPASATLPVLLSGFALGVHKIFSIFDAFDDSRDVTSAFVFDAKFVSFLTVASCKMGKVGASATATARPVPGPQMTATPHRTWVGVRLVRLERRIEAKDGAKKFHCAGIIVTLPT
jgi:hypothetical protein